MTKSADAFRTISEVADWLGVQTHVLRFWESKFTQVKPVKRAGGRRYYRPADMLLLGGIRKLLHDDGLTIKGVQKILREEGMAHVADMSPALDDETTSKLDSDLVSHSGDDVIMPAAAAVPPAPSDPEPIKVLDEGPFLSGDSADDGPASDATPSPLPSFMRTTEAPASVEPSEGSPDEDVPTLTPDFGPFDDAPAPHEFTPSVEQSAEPETKAVPEPIIPVEDAIAPDPQPELFAPEPEPSAPQSTPESVAAEPAPEATEPVSEPEPEAVMFEPEPEPDAVIPEPEPEPEAALPAPEPFLTDPEPVAAAPEPFMPEAEPEPAVQEEPVAATAAPEPEPEAAPAPRPRIVDVPDDVDIDASEIAPSALTKAFQLDRLTPAQGDALRPLIAQLTALRDQMARARQNQR